MPKEVKYYFTVDEVYSKVLSNRNILRVVEYSVFNSLAKDVNFEKTSVLSFIKKPRYMTVIINENTYYLNWTWLGTAKGPQKSDCTTSNILLELDLEDKGKEARLCFDNSQDSCLSWDTLRRDETINLSLFKSGWTSWRCHLKAVEEADPKQEFDDRSWMGCRLLEFPSLEPWPIPLLFVSWNTQVEVNMTWHKPSEHSFFMEIRFTRKERTRSTSWVTSRWFLLPSARLTNRWFLKGEC